MPVNCWRDCAPRSGAVSAAPNNPEVLVLGRLTVDLARREARTGDEAVHFTPLEFRLLEVLARNLGLVVTQEHLIREVWGPGRLDDTRRLRSYIKLLRQKLEPEPGRPQILVTEAGVGYRLLTSRTPPP